MTTLNKVYDKNNQYFHLMGIDSHYKCYISTNLIKKILINLATIWAYYCASK